MDTILFLETHCLSCMCDVLLHANGGDRHENYERDLYLQSIAPMLREKKQGSEIFRMVTG
jgi:hypothetical protein